MKLPDVDAAIIPPQKITDYLLSLTHRDGRSKAKWFLRHGFSVEKPHELVESLLIHARASSDVREEKTSFGSRFIVEGSLMTPDQRNPSLRAIWFIEPGKPPRLVTAYPVEKTS